VALLVGVNSYRNRGMADHPLQYAERDVDDMGTVLRAQGFQITLLKGKDATRDGINLMLVDACRDNPSRGRGMDGNELEGRLPVNTALLFSCAARQ